MLGGLAACAACAAGAGLWASRSSGWRSEEHPHEWLFTALALGRRDIVVKGDPDVSWEEVHPHYGTPLHAVGADGIDLEVDGWPSYSWTADSTAFIKDLLALFEFALKRGADPRGLCPRSCTGRVRFTARCGKSVLYDLREPVSGRSVLSLWLAFSQRAKKLDGEKPDQLPLASAFFDSVLSLLLHVVPKHSGCPPRRRRLRGAPAMTEVPEATAGLWRRVMEVEEPCDVVLACAGGEVRVHSAVVAHASKVLDAMLRWPRDAPSEPWRVPLQDRREAVEAWRVLVYTGLPPAEGIATDLLLEVLDLSHRWQDHLFECGILSAALARRVVDGETCAKVLEAAVAKDLPELRSECLAFARRSYEMRRAWEGGQFTGEVERRLAAVLDVPGEAASVSRGWGLSGARPCGAAEPGWDV